MADPAGGQHSSMAGLPSQSSPPTCNPNTQAKTPLDYSNILKPNTSNPLPGNAIGHAAVEPIPIRRLLFLNGQPLVNFTEAEVDRMNIIEGLQYVVVGKFSYGWPDLQEIRRIFPAQCGIKRKCTIEVIRDRYILIRLTLWEDFINFTAKNAYYIKAKDGYEYQLRPLIYDAKFKAGEETPMAMA